MPTSIPSTSAFPFEVTGLERSALEETYLNMRSNYKSLMVSRGKYRGQSQKSREALAVLEERLREIAEREASLRAEAYGMLQIVTDVICDLEDAGDDLVTEFESYQKGRRSYAGGSFLGRLIQAVIRFITRWTRSKEQLQILIDKQESMKEQLQESDGSDS